MRSFVQHLRLRLKSTWSGPACEPMIRGDVMALLKLATLPLVAYIIPKLGSENYFGLFGALRE